MFDARKYIIVFFEKWIFPYKGNVLKTKEKKSEEESEEESEKERVKKFLKHIENESKDINYDLFKDYFNFVVPTTLTKKFVQFVQQTKSIRKGIKNCNNNPNA